MFIAQLPEGSDSGFVRLVVVAIAAVVEQAVKRGWLKRLFRKEQQESELDVLERVRIVRQGDVEIRESVRRIRKRLRSGDE